MNKWFLLFPISLVLVLFLGCTNSPTSDSTDYTINIMNTSGLSIDSVVITNIGTDSTRMSFSQDDLTITPPPPENPDQSGEIISVTFTIQLDGSNDINVSYLCYSNDIPVITKRNIVDESGTVVDSKGGADTLTLAVLKEYDGLSGRGDLLDSLLFDSLFVEHILRDNGDGSKTLYNVYKMKYDADTNSFINLLLDTLQGRDANFAIPILMDKLKFSNEVLQPIIAANIPDAIDATERFVITGTFSSNANTVSKVHLELTGDNIIEPLIKEAVYDPTLTEFSGYIDVLDTGTQYTITVKVYDALERIIGVEYKIVSTLSYAVTISPFDACNAKPIINFHPMSDTAVALNDSLYFSWSGSDLNGTIVSYAFKEVNDAKWTGMDLDSSYGIRNPAQRGSYQYLVEAIDNDSNVVTDTLPVTVINRLPLFVPAQFSVAENAQLGTEVGIVSASDFDNDTLTYAIIDGGAADAFEVNAITGAITVSKALDFESIPVCSLTIGASDGSGVSNALVIITLSNVNEQPVIQDTKPYILELNEDTPTLFDLSVIDPENDTITWSIKDGSQPVNGSVTGVTGVGSIKSITYSPTSEFSGSDSLIVTVTDGALTDEIAIHITVLTVNDSTHYSGTPTMSGGVTVGQTLSIIEAECTDADDATVFNTTWYRNDTQSENGRDSIGTGLEYTVQLIDLGKYLNAVVTCTGSNALEKPTSYTDAITKTTFIDSRDGQVYTLIQIDTLTWMAENLNYSGHDSTSTKVFTTGYCYGKFDHTNSSNCNTYGRLYEWATAMDVDSTFNVTLLSATDSSHQGICPTGWHLPNDAEWDSLYSYVKTNGTAGNASDVIKSTDVWAVGKNGTDEFGFTVLPSGYGLTNSYTNIGLMAYLWSATENTATMANNRYIHQTTPIETGLTTDKSELLSVRCVQDRP